jgi:hypothetical protein
MVYLVIGITWYVFYKNVWAFMLSGSPEGSLYWFDTNTHVYKKN